MECEIEHSNKGHKHIKGYTGRLQRWARVSGHACEKAGTIIKDLKADSLKTCMKEISRGSLSFRSTQTEEAVRSKGCGFLFSFNFSYGSKPRGH